MTRLTSTMVWDVRRQWRNGFYYVVMVIVLSWLLLLSQVRGNVWDGIPGEGLAWLLPAFILGNLLIGTFYFMGGLLLLEKGEGTLEAQIITPLRANEYLLSKLLTLIGLSLIENGLLVAITYGLRAFSGPAGEWSFSSLNLAAFASAGLFAVGLILSAAILCLAGFLVVIRYDAINEYLLPSIVVTILVMLPLVAYLGGWSSFLLYLHPVQAALLLLQGAWQPLPLWQLLYGLGYTLLWVGILFRAAHQAFYRFVILKPGVSQR